jgi:hypothetical protein
MNKNLPGKKGTPAVNNSNENLVETNPIPHTPKVRFSFCMQLSRLNLGREHDGALDVNKNQENNVFVHLHEYFIDVVRVYLIHFTELKYQLYNREIL